MPDGLLKEGNGNQVRCLCHIMEKNNVLNFY
jgi:hypothetical protein